MKQCLAGIFALVKEDEQHRYHSHSKQNELGSDSLEELGEGDEGGDVDNYTKNSEQFHSRHLQRHSRFQQHQN